MSSKLLIESFYTGSHKQLIDLLYKELPNATLVTLPGKKWHWKARTSALTLSQTIPREHSFKTLFASSVLNLAELIALRPDLSPLKKILYFHENQLCYPVRKHQNRDFQFGYNQILSCLVADVVVFNSQFNKLSFLSRIQSHLKLIPDNRPKKVVEQIEGKCCVLNFPILFPQKKGQNLQHNVSSITEIMTDDTSGDNIISGTHSVSVGTHSNVKSSVISHTSVNTVNTISCIDSDSRHCFTDNGKPKQVDVDNAMFSEKRKYVSDKTENAASHGSSLSENVIMVDNNNFKDPKPQTITRDNVPSDKRNFENNHDEQCHVKIMTCEVEKKESNLDEALGSCSTPMQIDDNIASFKPTSKRCKLIEHKDRPLHIVWPHRWEHDKNPESLFAVLIQLQEAGFDFRLSVLGECFNEKPDVFERSQLVLQDKILHWGYQDSKEAYYEVLRQADVVISTALHEFFGVAMLEAVHLGCYPLVPNRLVYPDIFPGDHLYNTDPQLFKKLRNFCQRPDMLRRKLIKVDTSLYSWEVLKPKFLELFLEDA